VVLAIGASTTARPLRVPGGDLPHVVTVQQITPEAAQLYRRRDVAVVGSGTTAMLVVNTLCRRGARRVVLCSRLQTVRGAMGHMSHAERERQGITEWSKARYNITDELLQGDLDWLQGWREKVRRALAACQRRGVLEVRPRCELLRVNASHVRLRRRNSARRLRRSVEEEVAADLVVASRGFVTDQRLVSTMGFPAGEVDPATGETAIRGAFAVGFDPPGAGVHHYGDLPGGRLIYDNWLCWGAAAAAATCEEVARLTGHAAKPADAASRLSALASWLGQQAGRLTGR